MKAKNSIILLCLMMFCSTLSMGQSSGGGHSDVGLSSSSLLLKENRTRATEKSNVVKIGFFGIFGLDPHLTYERVLTEKTSLNLTVAFINFGGDIPFTDIDGESVDVNVDSDLSVFTITPEYRIYLSKKQIPRGFYLGPYLRYAKYDFLFGTDVDTQNADGETETIAIELDGTMNSTGLGLQLGAQWVIRDLVTIDWGFFGFGFTRHQVDVIGRANADNVDFEQTAQDIEENLEDIPLIGKRIKFDANENSIEARVPFFAPSFRANLKVGILF